MQDLQNHIPHHRMMDPIDASSSPSPPQHHDDHISTRALFVPGGDGGGISSPLRVLFCHGLEGGPKSLKVQVLSQWYPATFCPDMHPGIFTLRKKNSVLNCFLKQKFQLMIASLAAFGISFMPLHVHVMNLWKKMFHVMFTSCNDMEAAASTSLFSFLFSYIPMSAWTRWSWFVRCSLCSLLLFVSLRLLLIRAVILSVKRCASVISKELDRTKPQILIGSSWGGAVASYLCATGVWAGPLLLLAPAQGKLTHRLSALAQSINFLAQFLPQSHHWFLPWFQFLFESPFRDNRSLAQCVASTYKSQQQTSVEVERGRASLSPHNNTRTRPPVIVLVHGLEDATIPFRDTVDFAEQLRRAFHDNHSVEPLEPRTDVASIAQLISEGQCQNKIVVEVLSVAGEGHKLQTFITSPKFREIVDAVGATALWKKK